MYCLNRRDVSRNGQTWYFYEMTRNSVSIRFYTGFRLYFYKLHFVLSTFSYFYSRTCEEMKSSRDKMESWNVFEEIKKKENQTMFLTRDFYEDEYIL